MTTIRIKSSFSKSKTITFTTLTNNNIFYLVLPRYGTEEDCFCPVFFLKDINCFNLNECYCLDSTVFNNTLIEFCRQSEDDHVSIQLKGLSEEVDGNRLSIFHEFFCDYNFPYRIYTHSFELAIGKGNVMVINMEYNHYYKLSSLLFNSLA